MKLKKNAKILGFIKTNMKIKAYIDAETGQIINTKKPWWSFIASEESSLDSQINLG